MVTGKGAMQFSLTIVKSRYNGGLNSMDDGAAHSKGQVPHHTHQHAMYNVITTTNYN